MKLRFAPSPTGYLHIGNARTAIYNYLTSRKLGEPLVLRIEDTDMERSSRESEESILRDLAWLGIEWTEGPDVGGPFGPYRQSERFDIYKKYTEQLLESGKAYKCYCSPDELETMRKESQGEGTFEYTGRCRELNTDDHARLESEGIKPTIRFRVPEGETVIVNDIIKGQVSFGSENIGGDFIIVRSDGIPVYNYIVVIDDTNMEITTVIRGEDHLSNTPKQILIAQALGLPVPEYAHHPLILGTDKTKLSKRHGITSVELYRKEGYLPESLMNYIAMIGWATESGEEILSIENLVKEFDINKLAKSAAVFDFQKLRWINGNYIRSYNLDSITDLFVPYIEEAGYSCQDISRGMLEDIIDLLRGKCEVLSDIKKYIGIFLDEIIEPDEEADTLLKDEDSKKLISAAMDLVQLEINEENYSTDLISSIKDTTSLKGKKLFMPTRAILTGSPHGPDLDMTIKILGFGKTKKRIEYMFKKYIG